MNDAPKCEECNGNGEKSYKMEDGIKQLKKCQECNGTGYKRDEK